MEDSIEKAIHRLGSKLPGELARIILLDFFRDRTTEILMHLDEQGVGKVIDFDKIGGTSNDD